MDPQASTQEKSQFKEEGSAGQCGAGWGGAGQGGAGREAQPEHLWCSPLIGAALPGSGYGRGEVTSEDT